MKLIRRTLALASLALVAWSLPATSQERVAFDGTSVTAVLPHGFAPMPGGQPGYMDMSAIAGVSAMQAPAALFDQLETKDMAQTQQEVLRQAGIEGDATSESVLVGDRRYLIIAAEVDMAGFPTTMWTAVSDRQSSVILSFFQAKLPTGEPVLDRDAVLQVLATVEVGTPLSFDDLVAGLGLRLTAAHPFDHNSVMGPMVMLHTQEDPAATPAAPHIVISRPPFSPGTPIDEIGVHQLQTFGDHSVRELKATKFGGAEGKRLFGEIQRNGIAETFVMYFAYVGDAPLVFLASGMPEEMDAAMIEVIDGIAESVNGLEN